MQRYEFSLTFPVFSSPKTAYHISLKCYVGGADFDRSKVDKTLAEHSGKQVHVLIDSQGGSLATGLSISAAFKNQGNVNVHFVGLNAAAATIASLGAAHISIDAGAMYLVHQCSMAFFEVGQSAGVSRGRNGFRKDKSGEKLAESEEDLLEHRTDGTDTFDTLYIGCEKFPLHDSFCVSGSGIL